MSPSDANGAARTAVVLEGVGVTRDGRPILGGVDWRIGRGERWALLGPNGAGKTTLLRLLAMRLLPSSGTVEVLGMRAGRCDLRAARRRIAFVSQSDLRVLRPTSSLHDVVLTGADAALEPWWHPYADELHARADALIARGGLGGLEETAFGVLSEGERQLALLARALMGDPQLILFDEPAAGLDLVNRERVLGRLDALATELPSVALVLVTHHTEEIPAQATHVALLRDGAIFAAGRIGEVLRAPTLSACFGQSLEVATIGGRFFAHASSAGLGAGPL